MFSNCKEHQRRVYESDRTTTAHFIAVPILDHLILPDGPKVMGRLRVEIPPIRLFKRNLHDTLVMRKDRPVTVTEVQAPYLDVFIGGASDDELRIA